MYRRLKIVAILFFCVIAGYAAGSFTYIQRLPSQVRLTEFTTHRFSVGVPFSATFHETAAVAKVNDIPLDEDLQFRLGRSLLIHTDSPGTAQVTIGAFGFPLRRITFNVVPEVELIPLGLAIGVRINTDGVMVLGTGSFLGMDGETHSPAENRLHAGDLILKANNTPINSKEELQNYVAVATGEIIFTVNRDGKRMEITVTPQPTAADDILRIGAWVRDSTKGIGTLTFYNPQTNEFGALGHGILDVDTKMLLSVRSGTIMPSSVTRVKRGARGAPGELEGQVNTSVTLGEIITNSQGGIFGTFSRELSKETMSLPRMPIAHRAQVETGAATILTNVSGTEVKEFAIEIVNTDPNSSDETKGMVIRITDPELLRKTGGIVQGMSGSPIIQNDRIIGAVTHVFVQDPTTGYGIFIEDMLKYCTVTAQVIAA